jgi:hypothetical protein
MRSHAFNADFDLITGISDMFPRLNDSEISMLDGICDIYGVPIQFGDPLIFLHFPKSNDYRMRELEFLDHVSIVKSAIIKCSLQEHRHESISKVLRVFSDVKMLSEMNTLRVTNDYQVVFMRKNHLIMGHKQ